MTLKQQVYQFCIDVVNEKIRTLQNTLGDLRQSAANETKSTAGDKHETALAMLQIEQANTGNQLHEVILQKQQLDKLNPAIVAVTVATGSLVTTNKGIFYLTIALGKIIVNNKQIIVLSPQSPLGKKLYGQSINNQVEVNGNSYIITAIH